jgi:GNAT superfamily N-acetyltransferase
VQSNAIRAAIKVFVQGYCFGRSLTYPHIASQVEGLWFLRDAERTNPADYRKEEWVAFELEAVDVDRIAKQHTRGRYFVCAATAELERGDELRRQYRQLGYRLMTTEPIFIHSLKRIPRVEPAKQLTTPLRICQVDSLELADRFAKASRSRMMTAEQIASDAHFRQYVAVDEDTVIGWVRSVRVANCAWVANMHVEQQYRRRGIGSSLLERLLRDDRRHGIRQSVLLASHIGALLYPKLGYKQIGLMYIFAPRR